MPARRTVHKPPSVIPELLSPTIREGVDIHGDLGFPRPRSPSSPFHPVDRQNIPRRIRLSVVVGVGKARVLIYPHASIPGRNALCLFPFIVRTAPCSSFRPSQTSTSFPYPETIGSSRSPRNHSSTSFRRPDRRTASPRRGNRPG